MSWNVQWEAVTAVFTGLGWLTVAVGALLAYRQLKGIFRATALDAVNRVHSELHTDEPKRDRRTLYRSHMETLSWPQIEDLSAEELALVERVADSWQHVGVLVENRLVDCKILFDYFAEPALRSYLKLKAFVRHAQAKRAPGYGRAMETLAAKFEKRFKGVYGQEEFERVFGVPAIVGC